ncbi:MAG: pirin family protein [Acholeplasmataceae bacterium]|nr:pirin family protein [Acholeplasmataceae bacterium]
MSDLRTINKIVTGMHTRDGAGVKLVRVIGRNDTADFDPFLMLDAFDSGNPDDYIKGFPWHPHRGIETITYLLQGDIEHGDSLGNKGSILDGECQWMTAGSGIIHQEMPKASERMLGVQLWLNLPAKDKMVPPKYHGITKADIPVIDEGSSRIHIIGGIYQGTKGAAEGDYIKPLLLDVEVKPGSEWTIDTKRTDTLFIYIIQGEGAFDPAEETFIAEKHAVLFNEGSHLRVKASDKGVRFLLMAAKPLHEPVAWGGPIVMNTKEELDYAFQELKENTFIKHKV